MKVVVVACNTAAAAALARLQADTPVPVIGVIEPGVGSLVAATRNGRVGVIGTVGTIGSGAYQRAVAEAAGSAGRSSTPCSPLARGSSSSSSGARPTATRSTCWPSACWRRSGTTASTRSLLGCTHYPYLARTLSDVMGRDVVLVSSADETAFAVSSGAERARPRRVTTRRTSGPHRFVSSGDVGSFARLGQRLLGPELVDAEGITWD